MEAAYAQHGGGGDADDMQGMWQYLDSTLSQGAPASSPPTGGAPPPPPPPPPPASDAAPLTEDDNGMYNELGDVFNMFFNLDTDEQAGGGGGVDPRAALSRHASSAGDGISPGLGAGYPSMSPATMLWLQSLGKSPSSESLSGLISPAGLFSAGSASAGTADGLPRSPSMEMIDWKAYNDAVGMAENTPKDAAPKWRVIPQHGPHAESGQRAAPTQQTTPDDAPRNLFTRQLHSIKSTVVSLVGALGAGDTAADAQHQPPLYQQSFAQAQAQAQQQQLTGVVLPNEVQQQYELAVQRMADEKNKRKAVISPEYVQYSSTNSTASDAPVMPDPIKYEALESGHYATQVPDPTGRRPSKKSLHHATDDASPPPSSTSSTLESVKEEAFPGGGPVRCKCTGKCRNARCACVKAGFVCGVHCKCVGCANPFVPMEKEGIDIKKMVEDVCLMQFLSKVKDMQELLDSTVTYDCCGGTVSVKETVENGFTCPKCSAHYTYSWCSNRLCHDQKKPRKHCAKCRRCGDHRNEHCDDCNHCYFAGVANSFSCSCKAGKNGAVGPSSSGSGVKSRSVVPNVGDAMSPNSQAAMGSQGGERRGDENANPQTSGGGSANASSSTAASGNNSMVAGLSASEAEKEDACHMQ